MISGRGNNDPRTRGPGREGVFVLAEIAKDRDGYMMLVVGIREGRALRFADCVWLEPRVRAELTFSELVKGRLRDPVFRGLVVRPASALPVR